MSANGNYWTKYRRVFIYPLFEAIAQSAKKLFDPKKVLDIGCAEGFLVQAFRGLGVEAYGVDISEYAISSSPPETRHRLYRVDIEKDKLPFENSSFDLITMIDTIEHLYTFGNTLSEIRRTLRENGILLLTTPTDKGAEKADITHVNVHPRQFWVRLFSNHGFATIDIQPFLKLLSKKRLVGYKANTLIGNILDRLGRPGKFIRIKIGNLMGVRGLKSKIFIFKKLEMGNQRASASLS